jgi:hypothetical protein
VEIKMSGLILFILFNIVKYLFIILGIIMIKKTITSVKEEHKVCLHRLFKKNAVFPQWIHTTFLGFIATITFATGMIL